MIKKVICAVCLFSMCAPAFASGMVIPETAEMQKQVDALMKEQKEKADKAAQNLENINKKIDNFAAKLKRPFARNTASVSAPIFENKTQEEMERDMLLIIQNFNGRTALSKKEKERFLASYKEIPLFYEDYQELSKDIKREERKDAKALKPIDKKIVQVDGPRFIISKYNTPPGSRNLDLRNLRTKRELNSLAVISPNKDRIAYTTAHYTGSSDKIASDLYCLDLDKNKSLKNAMKDSSVFKHEAKRLLSVGFDDEYTTLFRSLTVVDWSADGTKLALKERVGSTKYGIWQTNLWVYDFTENSANLLVEVRDAVRYWWKANKQANIDDYMWDIVPMGWDEVDSTRIIVGAYGYTEKKATKFLGLFSVDYQGKNTVLVSETPMSVGVSASGLIMKPVLSDF